MTGPEHYRRAEVLLESCQLSLPVKPDKAADGTITEQYSAAIEDEDLGDTCRNALMAAQVHATLALAAATAASQVDAWLGDESREGRHWTQAVS